MTSPPSQPRALPAGVRYLLALGAVGMAGLARWAMTPVWGPDPLPYFFFFLATILVAWWLRLGPALLTLIAGALVANWYFVVPLSTWSFRPAELPRVVSFFISSLTAIVAIEAIHRANARAQSELAE